MKALIVLAVYGFFGAIAIGILAFKIWLVLCLLRFFGVAI